MCGIAGHLAPQDALPNRDLVRAMTHALAHRGPDGEGFYFDTRVGFGHRRLSFLDFAHGGQPLFNEDSSIVLICNGEIYNYIELRQELVSKGHTFATLSDCEVVLHLYEEDGPDAFFRLEGMFAFALWDSQPQRLLLVRDHFGIKPLYYSKTNNGVMFASELKALLLDQTLDRSIDCHAALGYLTSLSVTDPACILSSVKKVPSASYITFAARTSTCTRYWNIPTLNGRIDFE